MYKKTFLLLSMITLSFGQDRLNSRVEALAGSFIIPDLSNVLRLPSFTVSFPDIVQGTAYNETTPPLYGPALGIKSLTEQFALGVLVRPVNRSTGSSTLRSSFYKDARTFMANTTLPTDFAAWPQIIFGGNIDGFSFGVNLYLERSRDYLYRDSANAKREASYRILNTGALINARLGLSSLKDFYLAPLIGAARPSLYGENRIPATVQEFKSEKGYFAKAGAEAGFTMNELHPVIGFFYTNETYQFQRIIGTTTDKSSKHTNHFFDFYAGFNSIILNDVLFTTLYDQNTSMDHRQFVTPLTSITYDTTTTIFNHNFRFGFEAGLGKVWILDDVISRGGFLYEILDRHRTTKVTTAGETELYEDYPGAANEVNVTAGLGFRKGVATIDLLLRFGKWNGALIGPEGGAATLTLNFSGK